MNLLLLGLSHHTAPVDVRARVAARLGDVQPWLLSRAAERDRAVAEILLLSTCHRLECYVATPDVDAALAVLSEWFGVSTGAARRDQPAPWFVKTDTDAALHVCRVASGLESMIVGEAEIAGQVRRAAANARETGVLGPYLERVVAGALAASGRARSETKIAEGVRSAASAGVALVTNLVGSLADRNVLVIGAGQVARTVLSRLSGAPAGRVSVASRSLHHAHAAAATSGAFVWSLDEMTDRLHDVDVVIAATNVTAPLLTTAMMQGALATEPGRPRVMVDLSVPTVIETAIGALPGVRLFSVDDLGELASQSATQREREIPRVEAIVRDEAARAMAKFNQRRLWDVGRQSRAVSRKP